MKTVRTLVLIAVAWVCLAASVGAKPDQLTLTYTFDPPKIYKVNIRGRIYDRIEMPGAPNGGQVGQPALPAKGARILLPLGTDVSNISVMTGERAVLGKGFIVEPIRPPVKLSMKRTAGPMPMDQTVYGTDTPFPKDVFENVGIQNFRGYRMLILKLQPMHYLPTSGSLYHYSRMTVVVNLVKKRGVNALFRGLGVDGREVLAKVDNPDVADTYVRSAGPKRPQKFRLLILTTAPLASAFEPLKAYHDANGMLTEIRTTEEAGSADPDAIRNYIRDRYVSDGIEYVLIGGDDNVISAKDLYVVSEAGGETESDMPADIFFGCLDGTYNADGDTQWGESHDGEGGGDVDLVAEVYVGRAPVDDATEVARFVKKTLWYLEGRHAAPEKVLLVGEQLGFGGVSEYASPILDELVDNVNANGVTTIGIPSGAYQVSKLYDSPVYSWNKDELVSRLNEGVHLLNHLGHGAPTYAMKLDTVDITSMLKNQDLSFVYSQTCDAGQFDGMLESWAETMTVKTDAGSFAVIMNARYGWGDNETTDGPSQRFNREFWDAVYGEKMRELGRANQDSKEDNLYRVNDPCMRWVTYELNLFGDPAVAVERSCNKNGIIRLDHDRYACTGTARISVNDCSLDADPNVAEQVTVMMHSNSEAGLKPVVLTETDRASGYFTGSINLSEGHVAEALCVADGNIITATYVHPGADGEGSGTPLVGTAAVDCRPPTISNLQVNPLSSKEVEIVFATDEAAKGAVRYGLACDALSLVAAGNTYTTSSAVKLTGLERETSYFFAVESVDEVGNVGIDNNTGACYGFKTPPPLAYFTQLFSWESGIDLSNLSLTFRPNGSPNVYSGCIQQMTGLPTDPAGGKVLTLGDDAYVPVDLDGEKAVSLYGKRYTTLYVGSNGYITFEDGDAQYAASLERHFSKPRIAVLFHDLNPSLGGVVSVKQLDDRVAVTWKDVSEYGSSNVITVQVEIFFDGTIRLNYLTVTAQNALVGLSRGNGLSGDFSPTDFSAMGSCTKR